VLVRDWRSGEWTPVRKNVSVDPRQTIIGIEVPTACRFLTPSGPGSVNVRVRVRSVLSADDPPVIARFDHVQLIPGGDCARGDFNADGVVSFPGDLLSYLQLYFQGDGSADLNCSGTIGPDDIFVAIGLVMSCGR
jgi:hypothetical protein